MTSNPRRADSWLGDNRQADDRQEDGNVDPTMMSVPETVVGKLETQSTDTQHRAGTASFASSNYDFVDYTFDFDPGRVAIRIDGPDIMAAASDHAVEFTAARLVSPDGAIDLHLTDDQLFVGLHQGHKVFRIVLECVDEAKRYSTEWIQR